MCGLEAHCDLEPRGPGGAPSARSLKQLSAWCADRFGPHAVASRPETRPYDVPWLVLDASRAAERWTWTPPTPVERIFEEIAAHAERHPGWLDLSRP